MTTDSEAGTASLPFQRTAITGGIGSGKSYVCRLLQEQGISVYDCDSHAKRLMVESESLRRQLTALIGPKTYIYGGGLKEEGGGRVDSLEKSPSNLPSPSSFNPPPALLNKAVVARFLMSSPENARALEAIVHPAVIDDYLHSGMEWVESAILFESGLNHFVDRIVAVTAPEEVRLRRIMERDGITRGKALEWIHRQLPQDYLVSHSHIVIVNDGRTPLLPQLQAKGLISQLRR